MKKPLPQGPNMALVVLTIIAMIVLIAWIFNR
jgi:hypothetical protein